ncbi:MAG: hypothetical protein E6J14_07065 [Chloroflexi bacterium]|nr:MAG: hypothetical protein E6J14_07065 [Chloroflexota bacterium]
MSALAVRTPAPPSGRALLRRPARLGYPHALLALTVLAAGLRMARLGATPLWRDEAFTGVLSQRSWREMLSAVGHDSAPPLWYLLSHLTAAVVAGPAGLRLPAALAGIAAVPLAAALGRRLGGDLAGLCSAAVVAFGPAFVLVSRDARMYSLAGTLVLAMVLALWRALEQPTRGRLGLFALSVCLCLGTQYFAALAVIAALAAAALLGAGTRRILLAVAAAAIGTLPVLGWLAMSPGQLAHAGSPFWVESSHPGMLWSVVVQFAGGPAIDAGNPWHLQLGSLQVISFSALVGGGLALLAALVTGRHRRLPLQRRGIAFLGACGFGGVALLLALSVVRPLFEAKYASVLWDPVAPVAGCGLACMPRLLRPLAPLSLTALAVASSLLTVGVTRPDAAALAGTLSGAGSPHRLLVSDPADYLPLLYARGAEVHVLAGSVPWWWGVAAYPPGAIWSRLPPGVRDVEVVATRDSMPRLGGRLRPVEQRCAAEGVCAWRYREAG